jgi:hypothetical protein
MKKMKNNISPGIDNIQFEHIKMGGYDLHELIRRVWQEEMLPEEWRKGTLCPVHKKGEPLDCKSTEEYLF